MIASLVIWFDNDKGKSCDSIICTFVILHAEHNMGKAWQGKGGQKI